MVVGLSGLFDGNGGMGGGGGVEMKPAAEKPQVC